MNTLLSPTTEHVPLRMLEFLIGKPSKLSCKTRKEKRNSLEMKSVRSFSPISSLASNQLLPKMALSRQLTPQRSTMVLPLLS